ncbi:MAG: hypothetical protein QXF46_08430 [Thermofilaceae archaeon]
MEVDGVVDTGAIHTVVYRSILEELGIKPLGRKRFKALGGYVEGGVGESGLLPAGKRKVAPVVFSEADDTVVVGLTALEISGLEVNAVKGTLKEAEPLLL